MKRYTDEELHPAWNETIPHEAITHIVHHEAETHVVHHPAITHTETICDSGAWVDVTGSVQTVVNSSTHSFLFDNRPSPGGIWNAGETTLLSQITDPLPNVKKQVKITYSVCGVEQSITVDEYATIDL